MNPGFDPFGIPAATTEMTTNKNTPPIPWATKELLVVSFSPRFPSLPVLAKSSPSLLLSLIYYHPPELPFSLRTNHNPFLHSRHVLRRHEHFLD